MVIFNEKDDYFKYAEEHPENLIVVYGVTRLAVQNSNYIGHIDFFCDENAKNIGMVGKIPCILPSELEGLEKRLIIINCMRLEDVSGKICSFLNTFRIEAELFHFYNNPAFLYHDSIPFMYEWSMKDSLRICIVNVQDDWILSKFAQKLQKELVKLGQDAYISPKEDAAADINHFVHFEKLDVICKKNRTVRTTMITHVDSMVLLDLIQYHVQNQAVGICMSSDVMNKLSMWGIPRDRLCYVNPAHDGDMPIRKVILGITNRWHSDFDLRKKDDMILQVCQQLDSSIFKFKIMGIGWDAAVRQLQNAGFEVDYYPDFEREQYKKLMSSLDYWMFTGFDEGGMGYLDALSAGVKTIVTPQGFHLDVNGGPAFSCSTIEDFTRVLKEIQNEKKEMIDSIKCWTWENYARKHLEIWQYLTHSKPMQELYMHQGEYMDGIFSMMVCNNRLHAFKKKNTKNE